MSLRATLPLALILLGAGAGTAGAVVAFARADKNRDGFVSYQEVKGLMPELAEISFKKFDKNGDDLLDRGEYAGLDNFYSVIKKP